MKKKLWTLLQIVLGNLLLSFSISTLLVDNGIIAGGISGIGLVLRHFLQVDISITVGVINVVLFVVGFLYWGKNFAMTTLVSTFLFPLLLDFFERCTLFHGYLQDPLLACILAGCLNGIGIGLIIRVNSSTGGLDILALLISKKFRLPLHRVLNALDVVILALQFFFNDSTHVIYGIVCVVITSGMLNRTLTAGKSLIQVLIISDEHEKIRNMLLHDQDAGLTLLDSEKGYTAQETRLLLSIVPYRKLPGIKRAVREIDPKAFLVVSNVAEVGDSSMHLSQ